MSRFALKIYTALFIMGALPLSIVFFVRHDVLVFNNNLQMEALDAIESVSEIQLAWKESVRSQGQLLALHFANDPDIVRLGDLDGPPSEEEIRTAREKLKKNIDRFDVLMNVEIASRKHALVLQVEEPKSLDLDTYKLYRREFDLQTGHSIQRGLGKATITPRPILRLTFGIPREQFRRFEDLGRQRKKHLLLGKLENTPENTPLGQTFLLVIVAMVLVLMVGLALVITIPLNRRIARLVSATKKVAAGDLSVRVEVKGRDEIADLTKQFNHMLEDLLDANSRLKYLEQMSAWQEVARRLAHEIKNPLTPLLLSVQQLDRTFDDYHERPQLYRALLTEVVEIVTEEVDTLQKLVKEFSEFARLPEVTPEPTEWVPWVAHFLKVNPQLTQAAEISHEEIGGDLWVKADTTLMRRVLVNLIDNAIEAIIPTGRQPKIQMSYELKSEEALLHLILRDNGPGVLPIHIKRLFEPYFTTKETGTGLGLAIVRKVLLDHGGEVMLSNIEAPDGEVLGAEVRVVMPLIPTPDHRSRESELEEPDELDEADDHDELS